MKYNTISASSLSSSDCKKSTLTIYTDPDFVKEKISTSDAEIASVRGELEIVQRALKLQTKRCRQLVAEYTRRLQQKEQQYQCERNLRNDQLAKVLRALLIFEARLRQEQKFISHQLSEKDYIIKKQRNDITKLMSNQYCKHCNQYYSPASNLESLDSSSEYVVTTDYQDYQSSNFESLDSSSETYATISEKEYDIKSKTPSSDQSYSGEEHANSDRDVGKIMIYQKNKLNKDSLNRRGRKLGHRKSVGTYFEVLKMRNESPTSNEDNTSNDYENLDSLPPESITDKISVVSERIENIFAENGQKEKDSSNSSSNGTDSDCNNTVIQNCNAVEFPINFDEDENKINKEKSEEIASKISNLIPPVFDGDGETNDKWYASGSELEDEEQRDIYRNNPVLECMNQILLHNINDATISPPKTPTVSRKFQKNKRVKFSDAEEMESSVNKDDANRENTLSKENLKKEELNEEDKSSTQSNYYETPIQKQPNFYETPQSIYSNDYEQILSKCSESFSSSSGNSPTKLDAMQEKEINMLPTKKLSVIKNIDFESTNRHYYDMDAKVDNENEIKIVRKSKILRIPPALPPKPTNLVSKYKLQNLQSKITIPSAAEPAIESEPDYCSISELNIPTNKNSSQKISVVAEINILDGTKDSEKHVVVHKAQISEVDSHYDPVVVNEDIANLVSKNIEKFNMQMNNKLIPSAVKTETSASSKPKPKPDTEIPKLPQVSEIIIPEETEESAQEEERISQDNYIKNNSQILLKIKGNTNKSESLRRPIVIGKSVSSLITGFNNHQLLSEIHQQPPTLEKPKNKITFPGFEANSSARKAEQQVPISPQKTPSFDKFDLSQNFEEFKLEDCQIGEEYDIDNSSDVTEKSVTRSEMEEHKMPDLLKSPTKCLNSTRVELVRATNNVTIPQLSMSAIQQFRKKLELQKSADDNDAIYKNNAQIKCQNEPTYEHFLECTGLSSKSILTPSRLLSNHKSVLKPKDVKLRSKVRSNNVFERQGSTIKYWSEPYI